MAYNVYKQTHEDGYVVLEWVTVIAASSRDEAIQSAKRFVRAPIVSDQAVIPITPWNPVCMGVVCERHAQCQRYHNVDGATTEERIATCMDGAGERPLFVQVKQN